MVSPFFLSLVAIIYKLFNCHSFAPLISTLGSAPGADVVPDQRRKTIKVWKGVGATKAEVGGVDDDQQENWGGVLCVESARSYG